MAMWSPPESTGGEISLYVARVYYRSTHFQFKINVHYYTTEREWIDLQDTPPERTFFMQVEKHNTNLYTSACVKLRLWCFRLTTTQTYRYIVPFFLLKGFYKCSHQQHLISTLV